MRRVSEEVAARLDATMDALFELVGMEPGRRVTRVGASRFHAIEAGSGRPVLLIHGGSGGCANWYRLFPGLSREFKVVAPDLPGFGLSEAGDPAAPLGEWTAERIAEWLSAVGWTSGDVVGTSFGGQVAIHLALAAPDRVRRLVLLNATGLGPEISWLARLASLPGLRRQAASTNRSGTAWMLRRVLTADRSLLPPEHERALVSYLHAAAMVNARVIRSAYAQVVGPGGQREIVPAAALASIRQESLVLWGSADRFLPAAHGLRAAQLIPHARFEALRGVGHSPNWERPDIVVARIRSFLLRDDAPA